MIDSWMQQTMELLADMDRRKAHLLDKLEELCAERDRLGRLIEATKTLLEIVRGKQGGGNGH